MIGPTHYLTLALAAAAIGGDAAPPRSPPPNYGFECNLYPAQNGRIERLSGSVTSSDVTEDGVPAPEGFSLLTFSIASSDERFQSVVDETLAFSEGLIFRPQLTVGLRQALSSQRVTRYAFNLPQFVRADAPIPEQGVVSVSVRDYASEYGDRFRISSVGICEFEPLELQA
ncbi:MAG: hypothetical protein KDD90_02540 [Sphingomonadaceae bacterium]|jgi:hypothetical protein|nr:hypothetical protein [Sphingomonadaceae bacterium]